MFKYKYDTCFIWIDVEQSLLNRRVDMRVNQMVNAGDRKEVVNEEWRNTVVQPCLDVVKRFLKSDDHNIITE
ncbi:hypothetical protein H5410_021619 [Solanum commersonii]|uniref:Uncharacterized protein n=1 Tax=Solanum commersonii TaxID=4109 RepID=A0A9J5ZCG2_SOLCO|nr:hypothetical protein H5410_021619 [Solanum commersonii]